MRNAGGVDAVPIDFGLGSGPKGNGRALIVIQMVLRFHECKGTYWIVVNVGDGYFPQNEQLMI